MAEPSRRFTLRDLPFVARLTLAAFLCSVGLGYLAAMVQLSVQQAKPGSQTWPMPGPDEVVATYHGKPGVSTLERLVEAPETAPFNASGSMRKAFTSARRDSWKAAIKKKAGPDIDELDDDDPQKAKKLAEAEASLRKERNAEADALVSWIRDSKLDKKAYADDDYKLPDSMKDLPVTSKFVNADMKDGKHVKIQSIISTRCAVCHGQTGEASFAPLEDYAEIKNYADPDHGGMPLRKLAQTTHVHLLGFSMLYMLTGFIFACSGWPGFIRFCIAPLALVGQVVDISFWWLARLQDPYGTVFAKCIIISGGIAGLALALQIILSLFSLFGWFGRFVVLLLLLAAAGGGGALYYYVVGPYIEAGKVLAGS